MRASLLFIFQIKKLKLRLSHTHNSEEKEPAFTSHVSSHVVSWTSSLLFLYPCFFSNVWIRIEFKFSESWIPYFFEHWIIILFSSVQFSRSVVSDSLQPHESQHSRPPCPSPTPGVHSDSRPSSQWWHPAISSSVVPFSSCPNPSQHQGLFQWVNPSYEVAKVLEFQL